MIQSIPLNKLVPSKRNVRRQNDEAADAQLRADIEARGLLQNLIVTAARKPRDSYATTPDRDRQVYVFEQMAKGYGAAHPDSVRRMMTQATVAASDPRARFVGEEAYLEAGGRIERDLFADEASTRWLDIAILERLASEKMEAAAAATASETGLGWVRPSLDQFIGWQHTEGLERVPLEQPSLSDEEEAKLAELESAAADHVAVLEDEEASEEERATAETKLAAVESAIEAITEKAPVVDEALLPQMRAFLVLGADGQPKLHNVLYVEKVQADADGEPGEIEGRSERPNARKPGTLSQRLVDELAIQRRDILAAHVAADPDFALDVAIFLMVDRQPGYGAGRRGSSLSARPPQEPVLGFKTPDAAATIARGEANEALDRSWTSGESLGERFDAFRALAAEARAAWLGYAVAGTLEASLNVEGPSACRFHDHLGRLLGIDVAAWWRPTAINFFDRVAKPVMFEALADVGGPALAARYASSKKAALAETCEKIFSGNFIGEVEVKDAARVWVPTAMQFGPADAAAPDEAGQAADTVPTSEPIEPDADRSSLQHEDSEAA